MSCSNKKRQALNTTLTVMAPGILSSLIFNHQDVASNAGNFFFFFKNIKNKYKYMNKCSW